ncbi:hypothetical protein R4Z09_13640 [Niallia oryzisoli]|uniref:Uncharacterized protein n=1 Tax=Niallia oryzisoli TaxID=1737571 RepID=A0ABZ2CPP4_9BACI
MFVITSSGFSLTTTLPTTAATIPPSATAPSITPPPAPTPTSQQNQ